MIREDATQDTIGEAHAFPVASWVPMKYWAKVLAYGMRLMTWPSRKRLCRLSPPQNESTYYLQRVRPSCLLQVMLKSRCITVSSNHQPGQSRSCEVHSNNSSDSTVALVFTVVDHEKCARHRGFTYIRIVWLQG